MTPLLLLVFSNTGNTKTFIDFFRTNSNRPIEICYDLNTSIKDYDKIVIGSYTWGNGKIPSKLKKYLIDNRFNFDGKEVFIFGSGNSIYPNFCGAVDGVEKICSDCGSKVFDTFKFEQRFNEYDLTDLDRGKLRKSIQCFTN